VTSHTLALTIAYAASVVGVITVVPQILRTVRHPNMRGVAPLSWAISAVACTGWITYGVRAGVAPQIPGNVLLVAGAVAIVLLVPSPLSRSLRALLLLTAAMAVVGVSTLLPAEGVGYLAFGIGLFSAWPQVFATLRGTREDAGVSLTTFSLRTAAAVGWLSYAVIARDVPVVLSAMIMLSTTLLVLVVEASRRTAPVLEELQVLEPA
jgi:uncharacterized protein with PQ loop repeat